FWLAHTKVWQGWVLAEQGQQEEGISLMRHGMAAFRAAGAELERQYWLALLGEVYAKMGQQEKGRNALAEARAIVDKTGEHWWEAELHRLEGELMLQSKTSPKQVSDKSRTSQNKSEDPNTQHLAPSAQAEAEAESSFHKALEVAHRQEAKSLELRAATSLARLWQQQGKKAEAHQLLAPVYHWFTEGFDTKDLQEAKALLEELH